MGFQVHTSGSPGALSCSVQCNSHWTEWGDGLHNVQMVGRLGPAPRFPRRSMLTSNDTVLKVE